MGRGRKTTIVPGTVISTGFNNIVMFYPEGFDKTLGLVFSQSTAFNIVFIKGIHKLIKTTAGNCRTVLKDIINQQGEPV
jgi:hypothetical protein